MILLQSNKITYIRWAGNGRYRVSPWFCSYPARSRTNCRRVIGNTKSVCGSAAIHKDHLHPVDGQWDRLSQCMFLQLSSKITYILWGGYKFSAWHHNYLASSRTGCWWVMGDTKSVCGSAVIQQDHVPTVGGQQERQSQCVVLQQSSKITYFL